VKAEQPLVDWVDNNPEDGHSAYLLAKGLKYGWFGDVNEVGACINFKRASEQEDHRAYWDTGMCYLNGTYVAKDETLAFDWIMRAADEGIIDGLLSAGVMHALGQGTETDPEAAAGFYLKAIEASETGSLDQAHAMRSFGAMHYVGEVENGNQLMGYGLILLASELGDGRAIQIIEDIGELSEEDEVMALDEMDRLKDQFGLD